MKPAKLHWLSAIVLAATVLATGCAQLWHPMEASQEPRSSAKQKSMFFNEKSHKIEESLNRFDSPS